MGYDDARRAAYSDRASVDRFDRRAVCTDYCSVVFLDHHRTTFCGQLRVDRTGATYPTGPHLPRPPSETKATITVEFMVPALDEVPTGCGRESFSMPQYSPLAMAIGSQDRLSLTREAIRTCRERSPSPGEFCVALRRPLSPVAGSSPRHKPVKHLNSRTR
jgi:hypothetical protein